MNVTPKNKCYDTINSLILSFTSLYFALEYVRTRNVVICNPGNYMVLEGLASGKMIRLPLFGPIETTIKNLKPDLIEITIEDLSPSTQKYEKNITILGKTIDHITLPHLIMFYESNLSDAEVKFGKTNHAKWPASWRMGWVVRNALSHNNRIHYKTKETPPVTWNLLTVSPSMQDIPIGTLVNFTDIVLLIFDMENDLNK